MWELRQYKTEFSDFLAQWQGPQHKKRLARILFVVNRLRMEGIYLRGDFVDSLRDGIRELRISHDKQIFRMLYFFRPGQKIFFVVCFEKKTQKTPSAMIDLAIRRKREIELDEALADAVTIH